MTVLSSFSKLSLGIIFVAASSQAAQPVRAVSLGTYRVTEIAQTEALKGHKPSSPHKVCVAGVATPTEGNEAHPACGQLVKIYRTDSRVLMVKPEIGSYDSGRSFAETFLLSGKVFGSKCKFRVYTNNVSAELAATSMCQANHAAELDSEQEEAFTFFRDTTNPGEDAKMNAAMLAVFTGGLLPIGFGSAHKILLPKNESIPHTFTIEELHELVFGFKATVFKTYTLEREGE